MAKLAYILPLASCLYVLIASWWIRVFFAARGSSSTRAKTTADFSPAVSVLKPVRGLDRGAYDNFASYLKQDYPEYEVLFAVADPNDPAVPVIERLQQDFPHSRVRLIRGVPRVVPNPKVNSLAALTRRASHELVVISDSDMRVNPDYLGRVVAPLADPEVGLVTCCYRGMAPVTFTAKLEALHMAFNFLPEVVVARRFLDMSFALGATMALRRSDLRRLGGWRTVGAFLAEDTHLALQIRRIGKKVVLSDYIVSAFLGTTTWREQWDREVRWARTNRTNRPREYAGILLTLNVPLALVFLPLDGAGPVGWTLLGAALVLRWVSAWLIARWTANESFLRWLPWLPLRDLLSAVVWCAGLAGRRVVWRGQVYRLEPDGRMSKPGSIRQKAWTRRFAVSPANFAWTFRWSGRGRSRSRTRVHLDLGSRTVRCEPFDEGIEPGNEDGIAG